MTIIVAEAGERQNQTQTMNTNQFSLATRKQLVDLLTDKHDGLRYKVKSKLRDKRHDRYRQLLSEIGEKKGALKLVEQINVARHRITELEDELLTLGFEERGGGLSTIGDAGDALDNLINATIDKELGTSDEIDARFDSVQIAMMTVATLEDADKLLKSVSSI